MTLALKSAEYILKEATQFYQTRKVRQQGARVSEEKKNKTYEFPEVTEAEYILSLEAKDIRQALIDRKFKVRDVVAVYCQRCYTIGRDHCLSADELFEQAMSMADEKDEQLLGAFLEETTDKLPPLFGVPISVKDLLLLKGARATFGCDYLANNIPNENGPCIQMLIDAGAIPIVKGNIPQIASALHSENRIYGLAQNPYNSDRSCGGSSGGDCGMVAARCTPIAIGTDTGGSIRVPAVFTGVHAFKPTASRMSQRNEVDLIEEPADSKSVATGPIARSVDDLVLIFKVLIDPAITKYNPEAPKMPFCEQDFQSVQPGKIRVGYLESFSYTPSTDATRRAVSEAKGALEKQGYEVVEFSFSDEEIAEMTEVCIVTSMVPGFFYVLNELKWQNEKLMPGYEMGSFVSQASSLTRGLLFSLLWLMGERRFIRTFRNIRPLHPAELYQYRIRKDKMVRLMEEKWKQAGIEALVCPAFPSCAFTDKLNEDVGLFIHCVQMWNLVDYPCGIVPITRVLECEHQSYEDKFNDMWTKALREDIKNSTGMPIGVQVVAKKWRDEVCLGVMKAIDRGIKFRDYAL